MKRRVTLILCGVDLALWAAIASATFLSGSDPASAGLDKALGIGVTVLLVLTAGPALLLTRRAPNLALACALAFPGAFALALLGIVLLFSF